MQLHITGRSFEITPAIKDYATEKLVQHLNRYKNIINKINMVLQIEHDNHIAEATISIKSGASIHASAKTGDMYSAIDELVDKLTGQITKHKEKMTDHHRE